MFKHISSRLVGVKEKTKLLPAACRQRQDTRNPWLTRWNLLKGLNQEKNKTDFQIGGFINDWS